MKKLFKALAATSILSLALTFSILPALAYGFDFDNLRIVKIKNTNKAYVNNMVAGASSTGDNSAAGGDGGKVYDDGTGGDGGTGVILSGDADSAAKAKVYANETSTDVTGSDCGCDDTMEVIKVSNYNKAKVNNMVLAASSSGGNSASGGDGGKVKDDGEGGAGGDAVIETGSASSWASAMTVVNSTTTTIDP